MTSSVAENTDKTNEPQPKTSSSDFTIEHILNRAGKVSASFGDAKETDCGVKSGQSVPLPWLNCTRYCPPKIPRNQKREGAYKRQLGKHPRIPFTNFQLAVLEEKFQQSSYLSREEVTNLAQTLNLADNRVKIWFQNRRARERRDRDVLESLDCTETTKMLPTNATPPLRNPVSTQETCVSTVSSNYFVNVPSIVTPLQFNYLMRPPLHFQPNLTLTDDERRKSDN